MHYKTHGTCSTAIDLNRGRKDHILPLHQRLPGQYRRPGAPGGRPGCTRGDEPSARRSMPRRHLLPRPAQPRYRNLSRSATTQVRSARFATEGLQITKFSEAADLSDRDSQGGRKNGIQRNDPRPGQNASPDDGGARPDRHRPHGNGQRPAPSAFPCWSMSVSRTSVYRSWCWPPRAS